TFLAPLVKGGHGANAPLHTLQILVLGTDLLQAPFRALPGIAGEFGGKPDDGGLDGPVEQAKLLEPLESALHLAALHQLLDRIDRAELMAHADEGCRIVAALPGQPHGFVDEGLELGTGGFLCGHLRSIPHSPMPRDTIRSARWTGCAESALAYFAR